MEHHSNIVPWHFLRDRNGAVLRWVPLGADDTFDLAAFVKLLSPRTKLVAVTHMSNVLGIRRSPKSSAWGMPRAPKFSSMVVRARCIRQSTSKRLIAAAGHKLYGPSGIGFLYGKYEHLKRMQPYQGGGEMIELVTKDKITYGEPPHRFEAGTPLVRLFGRAPDKGALVTFEVDGAHPHDVSTLLDHAGIAVRAGTHCAQPLMERLGVTASTRASFALYNTHEEVEALVRRVRDVLEFFQ
jgi:cysteine desulfurase / selenocysteine lyase